MDVAGGPPRPYGRRRKSSSNACSSRLPRMRAAPRPRYRRTRASRFPSRPPIFSDRRRRSWPRGPRRSPVPDRRTCRGRKDRRRDSIHVALEVAYSGLPQRHPVSRAEQHFGHRAKLCGELVLPLAQPQNRPQIGAEDLAIPEPSQGYALAFRRVCACQCRGQVGSELLLAG